MSSSELAPQDPNWLVELALAEAVTNAERRFAFVRGGFCLAVGVSFLLQASASTGSFERRVSQTQFLLEGVVALLGIGFSAFILHKSAQRPLPARDSLLSVVFDAALCSIALGTNQFSPPGTYHGLLASVDVAAAPLVVLSSVLRVSQTAVWLSGAMMSLGIGGLILVDGLRGIPPGLDKLVLFGVYHSAAIALSLFITQRAKEIFGRVGRAAARAEHARGGLVALLSDHHDVRSDVCDLQLQVDLLGEALEPSEAPPSPNWRARVTDLRARIQASTRRLTDRTSTTRDRALSALEGGGAPAPADPREALQSACAEFRSVHPEVEVTMPPLGALPSVLACGGTAGLSRTLAQLLTNAQEGDGTRGASRIDVLASARSRSLLEIQLTDDGPGFPPELLGEAAGNRPAFSTKPGSLGIGLRLVEAGVRAAAGELILVNQPGGARVSIVLRASSPSD